MRPTPSSPHHLHGLERPVLEVTERLRELMPELRLAPGERIVLPGDTGRQATIVRPSDVSYELLLRLLQLGGVRVARGDVETVIGQMRRLAEEEGRRARLRLLR